MKCLSSCPTDVHEGIQRALPIVLGYVPVAFAFGVLAVKNGIPPTMAIAMSMAIFAGSGQFILASLWGAGVPVLSIILSVFIVNLRHLLMAASLSSKLPLLTRWQRVWLGFQLTDETFAVHTMALQQGVQEPRSFLICNLTAHLSWILGTVLGAFCGSAIQDVKPLGLDYALIAMFLALVVPQCGQRRAVFVGLFAVFVSLGLKAAGIQHWNIIIATIAAASAGTFLHWKQCQKENIPL